MVAFSGVRNAYAIGFELTGDNCRVDHNMVAETHARDAGESVGIALSKSDADHCRVSHNLIYNRNPSVPYRSFGVWTDNASLVEANTVEKFSYAIVQVGSTGKRNKNIVVDEECRGQFYANDSRSSHDAFLSKEPVSRCPDAEEVIESLKSISRKAYFYRKAQSFQMKDDMKNATVHFLSAARLGSEEASRLARRNVDLGLISQAEFDAATRQAEGLAKTQD